MNLRKAYHSYKVKTLKPGEKPKLSGKYFLFASRETTQTRDEVWMTWMADHGVKSIVRLPNGQTCDYFMEEKSWLHAHKDIAKYIVNNWRRHYRGYGVLKAKMFKASESLAEACVNRLPTRDILKKYIKYEQLAYDFSEYVMGAWSVITHIEPEVIKNFPEQVGIINSLEQPIEFVKMQHGCLKLTPKQLAEKYGWLNMYNPDEEPFSEKYFEKLKSKSKKEVIEKQLSEYRDNAVRFRSLLGTIRNQELKTKVSIVHTYTYLKTDRIDVWKKTLVNLLPFYRYLQFLTPAMSLSDVCNFTVQEVIDFLQNRIVPDKKEVRCRSLNRSVVIYRQKEMRFFHDATRIKEVGAFLHQAGLKLEIFKGISASGGKIQGKAVVIKQTSDLSKVKSGDVMFAKFTLPTYTHYMAKCKAIVTDEGGITSHAAVVSRELGIPCIVGAKIATQTVKDDDVVEVDAEKGMVKIIKRV